MRRKRSLTTPGPAKSVRGKTFYDQIRRQPPHHFDVTILPYTMQRIEKTSGKATTSSDERDDSQVRKLHVLRLKNCKNVSAVKEKFK